MPDLALTASEARTLEALLATLLPGDANWPGAPDLELDGEVCRLTTLVPGHGDALHTVLAALGDGFAELTATERTARAEAVEVAEPGAFQVALLCAYNAYYTDATVLETIEKRCGYEARPPQPRGFALEPFDEALLERQRAREPFWRQAT